ncbi:hypothetical protein B0H14DRAFT_3862781 [Mycena olivaceomarginata]|nr:hypothetical protein B0H14DRAFT_3862781 [Mycena olivaceomarginata]
MSESDQTTPSPEHAPAFFPSAMLEENQTAEPTPAFVRSTLSGRSRDHTTSGPEGAPVVLAQMSDNQRLIEAVQSGFRDLLGKQEEQNALLQQTVNALKPPPPTDKKAAFWGAYMQLADEHDKEFKEKYSTDLDTSLIFAGLFSAVSSAFILQILPQLQMLPPPPKKVILSQVLLYISLLVTLLTALLAVLGKQWIMYYQAAGSRGTVEDRGRDRQRKLDGVRKWELEMLLKTFPLLLQLGLLLFSVSLSIYLWTVHLLLAIVVVTFTAVGFAAYIFLLASAILDPHSPFQTPLAPFLTHMVPTTLRIIWRIMKTFVHSCACILSSISGLLHSATHVLPCFTDHITTPGPSRPDKHRLQPSDFSSLSPEAITEATAVAWTLETSTDPETISTTAELVVDIQWPQNLDLRVSDDHSCRGGMFDHKDYLDHDIWARISREGIREGQWRNLWSLNLLMRDSYALVYDANDQYPGPDILHACESFAADIVDLDAQSFTNYLCCINSKLVPRSVDPRIMAQVDKRIFENILKAQLFKALAHYGTTGRHAIGVGRILSTTVRLAKKVSTQSSDLEDSWRGINALDALVAEMLQFIDTFVATYGKDSDWSDILVAAAILGRTRSETDFRDVKAQPRLKHTAYIYMALQHVLGTREDTGEWDSTTILAIESLLQILVVTGPAPPHQTPTPETLRIILRASAMTNSTVSYYAGRALFVNADWLFHDDLVQIMQESSVWHRLGCITLKYRNLSQNYIELATKLAKATAWKPVLRTDLPTWIEVCHGFHPTRWSPEPETVGVFISVLRNVWSLDIDHQFKFTDQAEESWAMAVMALASVWRVFDFSAVPGRPEIRRLARWTVFTSMRVIYFTTNSLGADGILLSRPLKEHFITTLGESLIEAAANTRCIIPQHDGEHSSELRSASAEIAHATEQVADFLDTLSRKIGAEFEPGRGEVQIAGVIEAYEDWDGLEMMFLKEIERLEELLHE